MKKLVFILLFFSINNSYAMNKYTFSFQKQNHWIAQEDISPLRNAIEELKQNPNKLTANCSDNDQFCQQRVEILNKILTTQKTNSQIVNITKSKNLDKNSLELTSFNSMLILNFENSSLTAKSAEDFKQLLVKSELDYLSQFNLFCNNIDDNCQQKFNSLNQIIAKTLTFKYNFRIYQDSSVKADQVGIMSFRHDLKKPIEKQQPQKIEKQVTTKPVLTKKPEPKVLVSNPENTIIFSKESAILEETEKQKVKTLITNSPLNRFEFSCNMSFPKLCQQRVHSIKDYALKYTNNIIEMYQVETKQPITLEHVIVIHKQ